ncbi:hypothetical protein I317_03897 [Kwoniella heveanensis CBS 569]|nr:hypothetical protein I317_03897 [Kwoniella heveanensis CBS 569]
MAESSADSSQTRQPFSTSAPASSSGVWPRQTYQSVPHQQSVTAQQKASDPVTTQNCGASDTNPCISSSLSHPRSLPPPTITCTLSTDGGTANYGPSGAPPQCHTDTGDGFAPPTEPSVAGSFLPINHTGSGVSSPPYMETAGSNMSQTYRHGYSCQSFEQGPGIDASAGAYFGFGADRYYCPSWQPPYGYLPVSSNYGPPPASFRYGNGPTHQYSNRFAPSSMPGLGGDMSAGPGCEPSLTWIAPNGIRLPMPDPSSYGHSQVQASLETDHLDINTLYGRENGYEGGVGQYFGGYDQPSSGADLAAQQQAFVEASTYAGPKEVEVNCLAPH